MGARWEMKASQSGAEISQRENPAPALPPPTSLLEQQRTPRDFPGTLIPDSSSNFPLPPSPRFLKFKLCILVYFLSFLCSVSLM